MINKWIGMGRLTADPELKQTQSGVSTCTVNIAVQRDYADGSGEKQTDFICVVAWRQTAEFICKYFRKGKEILVEGQLTNRDYEAKDGGKRTVTELTVERVHFCGPKEEAASGFRPAGSAVSVEAEDFTEVDEQDDLPF